MNYHHIITISFLALPLALSSCDPADKDLKLQSIYADENATPDERRLISDEAVLKALKDAGADLTLPHSIEHHFVGDSQDDIDELASRGKQMGFTVKTHRELSERISSASTRIGLDLVRERLPVIKEIYPDSTAMERLAEELGIDYEGWGCSVRTSSE